MHRRLLSSPKEDTSDTGGEDTLSSLWIGQHDDNDLLFLLLYFNGED